MERDTQQQNGGLQQAESQDHASKPGGKSGTAREGHKPRLPAAAACAAAADGAWNAHEWAAIRTDGASPCTPDGTEHGTTPDEANATTAILAAAPATDVGVPATPLTVRGRE